MTTATTPDPERALWSGWPLTGALAVALVAMSAAVLAAEGLGREGVAAWVRATARSSALLFFVVYVARPLQATWPGPLSRFALRERRFLGVSVAVSHALHLAGILWLANAWPARFETDAITLVVGGGAFVLLFAMAATSSDAAVRRLGRRRWKALHRTGLHLLWLVFFVSFAGRIGAQPVYLLPTLLLGLGAMLRAAVFLQRGRRHGAAARV